MSILGRVEDKISKHIYVNVSDLVEAYVKSGYRKDFVVSELEDLVKLGLVESDKYSADVDEVPTVELHDRIKATYPGRYYIRETIGRFHYIDLALQDVPIFDKEKYNRIRGFFPESDIHGNRAIEDRRKTAIEFVSYLEQQESKEILMKKINEPG